MYALNHTTQVIFAVPENNAAKILALSKKTKKKFGSALYRSIIKTDVWSFFETKDAAISFKVLIKLDGCQS